MKVSTILLTFFVACISYGCHDLIDESLKEQPPHLITATTLYNNLSGFEAGLNGLYAEVRREREGISTATDLTLGLMINGTDDFVTNSLNGTGAGTVFVEWTKGLSTPIYDYYGQIFDWLYSIVNTSNTILNRAENPQVDWTGKGHPEMENKNRVLAEARFARAWAYRHLTYGWGDVPLNLEESRGSQIRTDWVRTPVREVREQIISDFLFATEHLDVEASIAGRPTLGAASHYLAEMYLALDGEYPPSSANVEQSLHWSDAVIEEPAYKLITERYGVSSNEPGVVYMDMFYDGNANREEGNTESLWTFNFELYKRGSLGGGNLNIMRRTIQSRYGQYRLEGVIPLQYTRARGGRGQSRFSISKHALELFEPQDDRFSPHAMATFMILRKEEDFTTADGRFIKGNSPDVSDIPPPGYEFGDTIRLSYDVPISPDNWNVLNWPWPRKVEGADPLDPVSSFQGNDIPYLRLAETYLLKAEAEYLLGNTEAAAEALNTIRRRSNASEITPAAIDLDFILDERTRELVAEEHRRWTLLRTGKWMERTRLHNTHGGWNITETDLLFPIPQHVIDANLTRQMPQNPGY